MDKRLHANAELSSLDRDKMINLIVDLVVKITGSNNSQQVGPLPANDPSIHPALQSIRDDLSEIKNLLYAHKKVFNADEAAKYLGISKSGVYRMTASGAIPHYKPTNGTLFFDRDELTEWALQNKNINAKEEAEKILRNRK